MSNSAAFNSVEKRLRHEIAHDVLPKLGELQVDELLYILTDKLYWPYFANRTTVRQNPNAAQPVAEGAFRDSRDTDDLFNSVDYEIDETELQADIFMLVDDPVEFYESRPVYDLSLIHI